MHVDREKQRVQLRTALQARGADLTRFGDVVLDKLWDNGYCNARALQVASREGLKASGLPPGVIDHILALKVLLEILFPSTLYCITFTLYDGVHVAMRLVSHAKANGFRQFGCNCFVLTRIRGEVRHESTSRSDFTLLLKTVDEASEPTLERFVSWLATQVPVRAPAVETSVAFTKAEDTKAARVEVTSDLSNPLTRDRGLLDMYGQGQLTVYAAEEVQLALEKAAEAVEQSERLSIYSLNDLGKSSTSSINE